MYTNIIFRMSTVNLYIIIVILSIVSYVMHNLTDKIATRVIVGNNNFN